MHKLELDKVRVTEFPEVKNVGLASVAHFLNSDLFAM